VRLPFAEGVSLRLVTDIGVLRELARRRSERFASLLARSGRIGNPSSISTRALATTLAAAAVLIPAGIILGALLWVPLYSFAALPLAFYFYPELSLRDGCSERKEGVEKELPLFSVLVNVLGSAGVSLYAILDSVVGTGVFEFVEREALLVRRDVRVFGINPNDSLERLASNHPSRKFGDFLNGYTSKVRSGGDLPSYLAGESGSLLREMEEDWARYSARVGVIGSMMVTLFGVVPMLLLVVGAFSLGTSMVGLLLYTGIGVPGFTVLLVFLAGRMQPVGEAPLEGRAARSLLLSVPALALGLLSGQAWVGAASMLLTFFVVYGVSVREQISTLRATENALPRFAKDMMEFKRQEYDLSRAVLSTAANNKYSPSFDLLLSRVAAKVRAGVPLDEVAVESKSVLARMVFFLLGQMSRSGGGSVETLFHLSSHTGRMVEMKRNSRAEMRPYLILSYVSPVMLAFGVTFVGGVVRSFSRGASTGLGALHVPGPEVGAASPLMGQVSGLLIVVSAAALGLIGAKMTDFTVRNTLKSSVNILIAVAALAVIAALNLGPVL
jgi:flagellar protein FlaJ